MSKTVIDNIVIQIKKSKYFSIIVDSTPDNTKVDQLTIIIRYITDNSSIIERFVGFLKSVGHEGEDMETALIQHFTDLDINFKNCRGQSYDNASNMSGIYNGLQARIKRISKQALFVPCAAHSLNLVGSNAAEATSEGTRFFFQHTDGF
ncbi:zinc finger MYM-type protein 1-like isoform X1 [Sipha flava]|uniref:Zinc finger MYM-type protein 1 n=1 Tax=Sipha flava TaxID=143950 RepID=A0A2S2Q5H8_9HEMI|nr:zinc finger MYM-type protein 1-like isoform X1 [Sipha flava]